MLLLVNNVVQKMRRRVINTLSLYKLTYVLLLFICFMSGNLRSFIIYLHFQKNISSILKYILNFFQSRSFYCLCLYILSFYFLSHSLSSLLFISLFPSLSLSLFLSLSLSLSLSFTLSSLLLPYLSSSLN